MLIHTLEINEKYINNLVEKKYKNDTNYDFKQPLTFYNIDLKDDIITDLTDTIMNLINDEDYKCIAMEIDNTVDEIAKFYEVKSESIDSNNYQNSSEEEITYKLDY